MRLQLNKAHFPVTVLGYGRRLGLWVQGCSLECPGCCSKDTWRKEPGKAIQVDKLLAWCREASGDHLDGVTISGGEPFEQPEALLELLDGLLDWRRNLPTPLDILCYTGLPQRTVELRFGDHLARLDAVVTEPFVESKPAAGLRGSANQRLIPLTRLGKIRYGGDRPECATSRLQVRVDEFGAWMIGIPRRGDMDRLETLCRERGLELTDTSWRA